MLKLSGVPNYFELEPDGEVTIIDLVIKDGTSKN
jgi:hypothetical protein